MSESASILIVGAGPTGLALACDLHRRGIPCRVVETAASRGVRSKAIAIWPRVIEILAELGVAQTAVERGIRLGGSTIWSGGRPALSFRLDGLVTRFPYGLVLPQYETEAILEARLGELGGKVERGVRCVGLRPDPTGVTVTLRHSTGAEEETRAGWVVGCDGADSAVREAAGIAMRRQLEPEGWIAADVRLATELEPTAVNYFLSKGEVLHVVPLRTGEDGLRWRITMNVGRVRPEPAQWPLDRLAEAAARRAAVPVRVEAAEWVTGFRVQQGLAERFRLGRVLLAGDAAHVHSPAGAQGINSGLQDAANLGWKLAETESGRARPALLSSYQVERKPAARATVRATDRATRIGTMSAPAAVAARNALWRIAARRGLVEQRVVPVLAGIAQRLRRSAASPGRRIGWPKMSGPGGPGARLPDLEFRSAVPDGARLWDLLSPLDYTVLLIGLDPKQAAATTAAASARLPGGVSVVPVADAPDHRIVRALRVRRATAFVVRPDRYIAVRCPMTRFETAVDYFSALLVRDGEPCRAPET